MTKMIFHQWWTLLALVCIDFGLCMDPMKEPLIFHFIKEDPQKVYIYFDPLVSVSKVTLLSTRDVQYTRNSTSAELREDFGPTHQLVGEEENDDGTKRYVFVKKSLCHEVDWTVAWLDSKGEAHGPITQRLGPSPVPWRPQVSMRVSPPILNTSFVTVSLNYELGDVRLNEKEFIVEPVVPILQLQHCKYNFKKAQFRPRVLNPKTLSIPTAYVQNECTFWVQLKVTVYDGDMECRIARTTPIGDDIQGTQKIALKCDRVKGLDCPTPSMSQPCDMNCTPLYNARAKYDYTKLRPIPIVRLSYMTESDIPVINWVMRHVQIDRSHFNFPLKEFNVTIERMAKDVMHFDFTPFSKDIGVAYGVQICALHDDCNADVTPNWAYVPQTSIFINEVIQHLPEPTTTTSQIITTQRIMTTTTKIPMEDTVTDSSTINHIDRINNHVKARRDPPRVQQKRVNPKNRVEQQNSASFAIPNLYICILSFVSYILRRLL